MKEESAQEDAVMWQNRGLKKNVKRKWNLFNVYVGLSGFVLDKIICQIFHSYQDGS